MNGLHDLGGKEGFGAVAYEPYPSAYHASWEKKVNALNGALRAIGTYNMDQYRHAIERIGKHYIGMPYFERSFTAIASLCVELGLFTQTELYDALGREIILSQPSKPGRSADSQGPFSLGDRVVVKTLNVSGHTRAPGYVHGKSGTIVGISPAYPLPDANGHGQGGYREPTYDVEFQISELWGGSNDTDTVLVGLFESYLSPA